MKLSSLQMLMSTQGKETTSALRIDTNAANAFYLWLSPVPSAVCQISICVVTLTTLCASTTHCVMCPQAICAFKLCLVRQAATLLILNQEPSCSHSDHVKQTLLWTHPGIVNTCHCEIFLFQLGWSIHHSFSQAADIYWIPTTCQALFRALEI